MLLSTFLALGFSLATTSAQVYKGFNYGSTYTDNSPIIEADFEAQFKAAKNLVGTSGFTSARLFTSIQAGTTNTPSEAFQAAINTGTSLLLGLWASGGQEVINNELAALSAAINAHGTVFTDLIVAISVGSEDLYRISPTGVINLSGAGAGPDVVSSYINQAKSAIANTAAKGKLVGHVDTWTAWVNRSNDAVITASDFIGMDAYPYFQNTMTNDIGDGYSLFFSAYDQTVAAANGKPVWVTETGWPVSGAQENLAVADTANAKTYWDQVGCGRLFDKINTWWYTLQDSFPTTPSPAFGVVGAGNSGTNVPTTPLYDLSCSGASSAAPSSAGTAKSTTVPAASAQAGGNAGAQQQQHAETSGSVPASATQAQESAQAQTPSPATSAAVTSAPAGSVPAPAEKQTTVYTTSSIYAVTMSAGGVTKTVMSTSTIVVTKCLSGCLQTPVSQPALPATTLITQVSTLPSASAGACPARLSAGQYEYPHLIIPVSSHEPETAFGTSYNGTINSVVSSIFNFDIPASDAGKTCSLIFLLPQQTELTTSAFELTGSGGLDISQLKAPATEQTTYNSVPQTEVYMPEHLGGPSGVAPGNEYVVTSGPCAAGQRIGYLVAATGTLNLNYFQDYNPSAIGFYITVC